MDDRLRALGRAARTEVEAGLDLDAELTALHARTPSDLEPRRTAGDDRAARRGATVWLAAAAAAAIALVGGIWFLGNDDTAIQTAEPETTIDTAVDTTTAGTTGPTTTAPSAPPGERTGQIRGGVAPPAGRFDAATGDLVELRADGTLWLRRDFATDPTDPGVRLLDDRYSLEDLDGVAVIRGRLVWSECCTSGAGSVWAVDEVDGERTLLAEGRLVRLSPDGTAMAMVDGAGAVRFRDLVTLEESSITEGLDGDIADLQWTADGSALLVSHDDDGRFLLSRIESSRDPVRTATVLVGEVPENVKTLAIWTSPQFAGANDSVVALVGADPDGRIEFFDATTLEAVDADHPWGTPAGRSIELAPDGQSLVYVADDGLHRVDGFGTDVLVAGDVVAAWYPVVSDTAPVAPTATTIPSPSTLPTTTVPVTTVPETTVPVPAVEVPVVDWRDLAWEGSGIEGSCVRATPNCTQLVHAADGTPVTYEPTTRVLTRHSTPEVSVTLPESYGGAGYVLHAGPDDVVYLQVAPAVPGEQAADVVAVRLAADDSGREVGRWADVANNVGDSELVPTSEGLVNVNCCGPDAVRPAPQGEVLVPWLDRSGAEIVSDAPMIRVEITYPSLTVHRDDPITGDTRSWTYQPGGDWMPRGMPRIVPTFDGGFIAAEYGSAGTSIARGFVDGTVEQIVLDDPVLFADSIDPAGRFLLGDTELEGWFVRVDPFPDRVDRWDDSAEVDTFTGTIDLGHTDAAIDAGAGWASDPVAFTDAVSRAPDVNELRMITAERRSDTEWVVTRTTSNFFDDSVRADRWELVLNRGEDGRFRFVSGQWSQACQPDRGHQDFSTELCV